MSADPNWSTLVDAATLAATLQHPQLRLLDARAAPPTAPDPDAAGKAYAQGHLPARITPISTTIWPTCRDRRTGGTRCRTARHSPNVWANGVSIHTARWWSTTRAMAAWRPHARGGCCG